MKEAKRKELERIKEEKRLAEAERLRLHRIEIAEQYAREEEEAIERGDFEEVLIEEFRCEICNKTFKKEG